MSREQHGLRKTLEYQIWNAMKDRCFNPRNPHYHRYGGRGITVCDRWRNSFTAFYADMGPKPHGHSIERRDNDGNYEPDNCRWATAKEQSQNKSTNVVVEHNGRSMVRKDYAKEIGLHPATLSNRINRGGMSLEAAAKMTPYGAKLYKHDGNETTLPEWAKLLEVDFYQLYHRVVRQGKSIDRAVKEIAWMKANPGKRKPPAIL